MSSPSGAMASPKFFPEGHFHTFGLLDSDSPRVVRCLTLPAITRPAKRAKTDLSVSTVSYPQTGQHTSWQPGWSGQDWQAACSEGSN